MRFRVVMMLIWVFAEALGYFGVFMVLYSVTAAYTQPWPPIEDIAPFASAVFTLLGTILTAMSVYLPPKKIRPAWRHSKIATSPIVVASCVVALYALFIRGKLPPAMVSGFSLMAIAGGLIRMLPYPQEDSSN